MSAAAEPLLRMRGIRKRFGETEVLKGVDFEVSAGEVHALVGQNGAGKSSLMKVLAGVYVADSGSIVVAGEESRFTTPIDAHRAGIRMVFQEFSLVPQMSVTQNIVLDHEPTRGGLVDDRAAERLAEQLFMRLGIPIPVTERVQNLRVGDRQMVEIAKALSQNPRILVLDEPTAALSRRETERLFEVVRKLRGEGLGIVFISHHMQEIVELCDRVTVLRDGALIALLDHEGLTVNDIIERMVPADVLRDEGVEADRGETGFGAEVLRLEGLTAGDRVRNIDLEVAAGEIVGVAGLLGSGATELLDAVFGLLRIDSGRMVLRGREYRPDGPAAAIRSAVALISEDRRTSGIVSGHSVEWNMFQSVWGRFARWGWIMDRAVRTTTDAMLAKLSVKTQGRNEQIQLLSGGNQQKVLIGRALLTQPSLLLLSEPTAGIDIRARADITAAIREHARAGGAAIWVSSDMQELSENCNRVFVIRRGELQMEYHRPTETQLVAAIQKETAYG